MKIIKILLRAFTALMKIIKILLCAFTLLVMVGIVFFLWFFDYLDPVHELDFRNVGSYNIILKKVSVDGEVVFDGALELIPVYGNSKHGDDETRPWMSPEISFRADKPKLLSVIVYDPILGEDKQVIQRLQEGSDKGCLFHTWYEDGEFLGNGFCDDIIIHVG
jgi:hypothetical protein